jgi:hypothetical protein
MSSFECDIIDTASDAKIRTVHVAWVPRVGEEMHLDIGERDAADGIYRVTRVLYHVRPRKLVKVDDMLGVSLYVERIG